MTQAETVSRLLSVALFSTFFAGCGSPHVTSPLSIEITVQNAGTGGGAVTSSPSGINCGSACSAKFVSGTSVTLTAKPDANSLFTSWSGACTGTGACAILLANQTTMTATFSAIAPPPPATVQLMVTSSGSGTGTVTSAPAGISCGLTCSASYASGMSVTLTANPSGGSTFTGWT